MKFLTSLLAAAALIVPALSLAAAPVDYSGTWQLDAAHSRDLPPYYAQVTRHQLTNQQDKQALRVQVDIESTSRPADRQLFSYLLDGTATQTATTMRTPAGESVVPTSMVTRIDDAGQVHITITRSVPMNGKTVQGVSTEDWQLGADGNTLTVRVTRQGKSFDLFFTRR